MLYWFVNFRKILQPNRLFFLLLFLIGLAVAIITFEPNTWLSGWDTLHPEFNFALNLERHINAVWQEHQGLGAASAQAYPAEVLRILLLAGMNLFLQTSVLRWVYTLIMLIAGPLGVYLFTYYLVKKTKIKELSPYIAFLAGFFYLFNLGTVQQFYIQQELFTTLYGLIGFLFLSLTHYLDKPSRRSLLGFAVTVVLALPIAHTPTLFFAAMLNLGIYAFFYAMFRKQNFIKFARDLTLLAITILVVNLGWLIGALNYSFNYADQLRYSRFDQLLGSVAEEYNYEYGDLEDVFTLEGFLLNWQIEREGQTVSLMPEWKAQAQDVTVDYLQYGVLALLVVGLVVSLFMMPKRSIPLVSVLAVSGFFLVNYNAPTGGLYEALIGSSEFVSNILRFPYTKFSIQFMFAYAVFVGIGVGYLIKILQNLTKSYLVAITPLFLMSLLAFVLITQPLISGNLIGDLIKVDYPDRYFQLFDTLNELPEGLIANFPSDSYAGWVEHDWGYYGAGFLWFGIESPLLDRDFDRWSQENEEYYQLMERAIYNLDQDAFDSLIAEYQISYFLYDESIFLNEARHEYGDNVLQLINSSSLVDQQKVFDEEGLYVWQVITNTNSETGANLLTNSQRFYQEIEFDNGKLEFDLQEMGAQLDLTNLAGLQDYNIWSAEFTKGDNKIEVSAQLVSPTFLDGSVSEDLLQSSYKIEFNVDPNRETEFTFNSSQRFTYYPGEESQVWYFLAKGADAHNIKAFYLDSGLNSSNKRTEPVVYSDYCENAGPLSETKELPLSITLRRADKQKCVHFLHYNLVDAESVLVEAYISSTIDLEQTDLGSLMEVCIRQDGSCLNREVVVSAQNSSQFAWAVADPAETVVTSAIFSSIESKDVEVDLSSVIFDFYNQLDEASVQPQISVNPALAGISADKLVLMLPDLASYLPVYSSATQNIKLKANGGVDFKAIKFLNFPNQAALILDYNFKNSEGNDLTAYLFTNNNEYPLYLDRINAERNWMYKYSNKSSNDGSIVISSDYFSIELILNSYTQKRVSEQELSDIGFYLLPESLLESILVESASDTSTSELSAISVQGLQPIQILAYIVGLVYLLGLGILSIRKP